MHSHTRRSHLIPQNRESRRYFSVACGWRVMGRAGQGDRSLESKGIHSHEKYQPSKNSCEHFPSTCVYWVMAMVFIVTEEPTSKVLRIMMLSLLMFECRKRDTSCFAIPANLFAVAPVRSQNRQQLAGNLGNTGLRSEDSSYPLRS